MQPLRHENNFDGLRLFAAILVIFSHSYPFLAQTEILVANSGLGTFGGVAVGIFFIISGYLITGSYQNATGPRNYFRRRAFRIFPGFIVSVLFCAFIIGPIATTWPLDEYFKDYYFWKFLRNINMYFLAYDLPGVFKNQNVHGVNGVYWTLSIEFTMYCVIALLGYFRYLKPAPVAALMLILYICGPFTHIDGSRIMRMPYFFITIYGAQFMAGSLLYLLRDRIRWDGRIALALVLIIILASQWQYASRLMYLCLPYAVIWLGRQSWPLLSKAGAKGDFSYGIYLYGFPIQQMLVLYFGAQLNPYSLFAASLVATLPFAFLSWHLVEKRWIEKKYKLPEGMRS